MDQDIIIADLKTRGEAVLVRLKEDLLSIRTGKPNPGLIEDLIVSAYGGTTKLRLKELASITTDPPQSLLIAPFDPSITGDIETAIVSSQLNITPQTQGNIIRVNFPPLTQDQRTAMIKIVSTKIEEYKEQLRVARDETRRRIKGMFEHKSISEDEKTTAFEMADKITKDLSDMIESIKLRKNQELMTV